MYLWFYVSWDHFPQMTKEKSFLAVYFNLKGIANQLLL
jgi:hypothetical protein